MAAKQVCIGARPQEISFDAVGYLKEFLLHVLRPSLQNLLQRHAARNLQFRRTILSAYKALDMKWRSRRGYVIAFLPLGGLVLTLDGILRVRAVNIPTFSILIREVRRAADALSWSFFAECKFLLSSGATNPYGNALSREFRLPRRGSSAIIFMSVKVLLASVADRHSIHNAKHFFRKLASQVVKENLSGNAYRVAAASQFELTLQSVIKRGLSSLLNCHDPDQAATVFLADLANRGEDRVIPNQEENVMYIAVSYRYQNAQGLSEEGWRQLVRMVTDTGKRLGYDQIRIWIDRIAVTRGMVWSSIGFIPYFIFPTFVHPDVEDNTNRLWIELEKFAAALGPGVLRDDMTEDDVMEHLTITRSPIEAVLAFCEVLASGCLEEYAVTYENDRDEMAAWARSVLTTQNTSQIFTMPRYDLEGRGEERHDLSMLSLFDDDIKRRDPVRRFIAHTVRDHVQGAWDGVAQLVGRSELPNSDGVREKIEKSSFVLHCPRFRVRDSGDYLCWHVLLTPRGKVIGEAIVRAEGAIRNGQVLQWRWVDQSQFAGTDFRKWFRDRLLFGSSNRVVRRNGLTAFLRDRDGAFWDWSRSMWVVTKKLIEVGNGHREDIDGMKEIELIPYREVEWS